MSKKKELKQEELEKVNGGLTRDLDRLQYDLSTPEGGAIYTTSSGEAKEWKYETPTGGTADDKGTC